jgi:ribosomal protein L11 methyltransferase
MRSSAGAMRSRTWCWCRWVDVGQQNLWIERLQSEGIGSWVFTQRPARVRVLLEVYVSARSQAVTLERKWGGKVRAIDSASWLDLRPRPPTRIGRALEIVHEKTRAPKKKDVPRLFIPHGLAFGSGEHATTYMLLRALAQRAAWNKTNVLDLGTGSGVLALAARLFGAKKIVATDFDAEAVRTARQNEALNFSKPLIRWRRADVKQLQATVKYNLVLANLFSGILTEASSQISKCIASNGQLWLSGILYTQKDEVVAAYEARGLRLMRTTRRGKWVMLQFSREG